MSPKISKLSDRERTWIASQLESASTFVEAFSPNNTEQPLSLTSLDRAFAGWLAMQETDSKIINDVINCVGIAFGQTLIDGVGLQWVIANDGHSTDLAVYGLPGH